MRGIVAALVVALIGRAPFVRSATPPIARHRSEAAQATHCALARPGVTSIGLAKNAAVSRIEARRPDAARVVQPVADVPLPGQPVRFDYQSLDTTSGQLYISHMNDGHVIAFDTRTRRVSGDIPDTPGVTGVSAVPALHKVYASVTGHHQVAIIDLPALAVRATAGPIGFPDGIAYAPAVNRIFVSDESGGGELVIDGSTDKAVARIPLGGEAGNTKYDGGSGCVLVAVQTLNQIVAIDPASAIVVGRYALARASHPHGMYVDAANRVLFVANEGNATVESVDLQSMEVLGIAAVGAGPDVLALDPSWHRLYVATESGGLWIYDVRERRVEPAGVLEAPHAHTVAVDEVTHLVYLPLQSIGGHPVLRILAGIEPKRSQ